MQRNENGDFIQLRCKRESCLHVWIPRLPIEKVTQCPKCKSTRIEIKNQGIIGEK